MKLPGLPVAAGLLAAGLLAGVALAGGHSAFPAAGLAAAGSPAHQPNASPRPSESPEAAESPEPSDTPEAPTTPNGSGSGATGTHPCNHGFYVSQAAHAQKGGAYVSTIAQSSLGKNGDCSAPLPTPKPAG